MVSTKKCKLCPLDRYHMFKVTIRDNMRSHYCVVKHDESRAQIRSDWIELYPYLNLAWKKNLDFESGLGPNVFEKIRPEPVLSLIRPTEIMWLE